MPRKPTKKSTPPDNPMATVDEGSVSKAMQALTWDAKRIAAIDEQWGDGLPYDFERVATCYEGLAPQAADLILRMGRCLVWMKEREPHGRFHEAIRDRFGIDPRTARRFMAAAVKFRGMKTLAAANLQRTHLLELATLDDDQLAELDAGGTIADLELDDMARMSHRELRAALRKAKTKAERDAEIHEKQLKRKDDKLNELDRKLELATTRAPGWQSRTFEIAVETTTKAMNAIDAVHSLHNLRDAILNEDFGEDADTAIAAAANVYYDAVMQLQQQAHDLALACHEVFAGYKESARPLAEMTDVFGPVEMPVEG
jgi:superoxide dismutase